MEISCDLYLLVLIAETLPREECAGFNKSDRVRRVLRGISTSIVPFILSEVLTGALGKGSGLNGTILRHGRVAGRDHSPLGSGIDNWFGIDLSD